MNDKHQPSVKKKESVFYAKLAKLEPITCKATVQISGLIRHLPKRPYTFAANMTLYIMVLYIHSECVLFEKCTATVRKHTKLHQTTDTTTSCHILTDQLQPQFTLFYFCA